MSHHHHDREKHAPSRTYDRPWRPSDPPAVSNSEWGKATTHPFEREEIVARDVVNRQLSRQVAHERERYERLARAATQLIENTPTSDWLHLGNYVQMPLALIEQLRRVLVEEKQG